MCRLFIFCRKEHQTTLRALCSSYATSVAASFFVHVDPTASNYLFSLLSLDARALFIGSKSQGMLRLHEFSQWDDVFVYTITSFPCQEKWLPVTSNVIYICSYKMILWFQSFMHLCKFCNP
jgi:hypothetical protein